MVGGCAGEVDLRDGQGGGDIDILWGEVGGRGGECVEDDNTLLYTMCSKFVSRCRVAGNFHMVQIFAFLNYEHFNK